MHWKAWKRHWGSVGSDSFLMPATLKSPDIRRKHNDSSSNSNKVAFRIPMPTSAYRSYTSLAFINRNQVKELVTAGYTQSCHSYTRKVHLKCWGSVLRLRCWCQGRPVCRILRGICHTCHDMSTVSSVSFHIFKAESLRVLLAIFLHRPWAVGLKLCWFTLKESFVGWCWLKENVWKCYGKPLLLPPSMEDLPLCRKQSGQLSNPNSLATMESHPLRLSFSVPSARHSRTNQLSWCAATYDSKIQVVTYKTICFSACKLMQTANTNALLCSSSRYHWGKMLKISWDWCQQNSGYKHLQPLCLQPPKIATKEHERSEMFWTTHRKSRWISRWISNNKDRNT